MTTKRHCDGCGTTQDLNAASCYPPRIVPVGGALRVVRPAEAETAPPQWLQVNVGSGMCLPHTAIDFCSPACAAANLEKAVAEANARAAKAEDDFVKFAGRYEPPVTS